MLYIYKYKYHIQSFTKRLLEERVLLDNRNLSSQDLVINEYTTEEGIKHACIYISMSIYQSVIFFSYVTALYIRTKEFFSA
jgi:hypothetical protein